MPASTQPTPSLKLLELARQLLPYLSFRIQPAQLVRLAYADKARFTRLLNASLRKIGGSCTLRGNILLIHAPKGVVQVELPA